MELARRRLLELAACGAGAALLRARLAAAQMQQAPHSASPPMAGSMSGSAPAPEDMQVDQRGGLYANLRDPSVTQLPADAFAQRFTYSPAPRAAQAGRWTNAAPLPLPRSEMAWATPKGTACM